MSNKCHKSQKFMPDDEMKTLQLSEVVSKSYNYLHPEHLPWLRDYPFGLTLDSLEVSSLQYFQHEAVVATDFRRVGVAVEEASVDGSCDKETFDNDVFGVGRDGAPADLDVVRQEVFRVTWLGHHEDDFVKPFLSCGSLFLFVFLRKICFVFARKFKLKK